MINLLQHASDRGIRTADARSRSKFRAAAPAARSAICSRSRESSRDMEQSAASTDGEGLFRLVTEANAEVARRSDQARVERHRALSRGARRQDRKSVV